MVSLAARLASATLAVTACAGVADAQLFIFSLSGFGRVIVNDTTFYTLPSELEVKGGVLQNQQEEWFDQVLVGSDHYHLRLDGLIFKNGARLNPRLPFTDAFWFALAVAPGGDVFAIDTNGRVAQNGVVTYDLPNAQGRIFRDFLYHEGDRYALRNDGKIYRNANATEIWDLPGEAASESELWVAFVYDDTDDRLYCLRRDGIVRYVANGGPADGTFVADLPDGPVVERFTTLVQDPVSQRIFPLRFDGSLWQIDPTQSPFDIDIYTDYPGTGSGDQYFLALTLLDGVPLALRFDGRLYQGLLQDPICQLQGGRFQSLAATRTTPVATNVKAFKPVVATYATTCYPGDSISFPILASDINTENLTLALIAKPEGSTYDTQTDPPTFSWTPSTVGSFSLQVSVAEGSAAPKTFTWKISVREPDADPLKNKKPTFQKLKRVQGLVGVPISIPLRAYDPDGDAITYSTGTLPQGMTFDAQTATLSWTPVVCSRQVSVEVRAADGSGQISKGKVQIAVVTPFWF
jgi:hypothetical protein